MITWLCVIDPEAHTNESSWGYFGIFSSGSQVGKKMIVKTKLTRTYREWKILSLIFQGESRI